MDPSDHSLSRRTVAGTLCRFPCFRERGLTILRSHRLRIKPVTTILHANLHPCWSSRLCQVRGKRRELFPIHDDATQHRVRSGIPIKNAAVSGSPPPPTPSRSLLLLAHQLGPSDPTAHPEFAIGLHPTKPFPSAAQKSIGASGAVLLLVLAAQPSTTDDLCQPWLFPPFLSDLHLGRTTKRLCVHRSTKCPTIHSRNAALRLGSTCKTNSWRRDVTSFPSPATTMPKPLTGVTCSSKKDWSGSPTVWLGGVRRGHGLGFGASRTIGNRPPGWIRRVGFGAEGSSPAGRKAMRDPGRLISVLRYWKECPDRALPLCTPPPGSKPPLWCWVTHTMPVAGVVKIEPS